MQDQVKADRDRLIVECDELRARVDYLESAIKLGGAAYRAARLGLGAPAVEMDDFLALKERAEKAEKERDALRETVEECFDRIRTERDVWSDEAGRQEMRAAKAADVDQLRAERDVWIDEARRRREEAADSRAKVARQRRELRRLNRDIALLRGAKTEKPIAKAEEPLQPVAALARLREIADYHADKGGTDLDRALRSVLDCERHEHDLTKAARDRLRNEPHIIEAGQTRYDAELWRARCLDAEERLAALRAAADYHADRGGTDLGRALAKVGQR